MVPYPYTIITLEIPVSELKKHGNNELLGHIAHVTDHKWSEQISNFAKWERNHQTGEPEPTPQ